MSSFIQSTDDVSNQMLFQTVKRIAEQSQKAYAIVNEDLQIFETNDLFTKLTQYDMSNLLFSSYKTLLENERNTKETRKLEEHLTNGQMMTKTMLHKRKDGYSFISELTAIPFQLNDEKTHYSLLLITDITHKQIAKQLKQLEHELYAAFERDAAFSEKLQYICESVDTILHPHSFMTIAWKRKEHIHVISAANTENILLDETDKCFTAYQSAMNKTSIQMMTNEELKQFHPCYLNIAQQKNLDQCAIYPLSLHSNERAVIIMYSDDYTRDLRPYTILFHRIQMLVQMIDEHERKRIEIYNLAYNDPYIGIPNRYGIRKIIQNTGILNTKSIIQLVTPSEFSQIVELYGRDKGEELLQQLVDQVKLHPHIQPELIGRYSNSTLFFSYDANKSIEAINNYFSELIEQPFFINDSSIFITLKSGTVIKEREHLFEDAMRHAEIALSIAKKSNGNATSTYSKVYDEKLKKEMILLKHLIAAISKQDIQVYLQPKVSLHNGKISSTEALARWFSPELGQVSPAEFVPLAEKAGIIRELDTLILNKALQWLQQRQYDGKTIVPVAVNISPDHFFYPMFVEQLKQLVQSYYIDPKYVTIEITEGLSLVDLEKAQEIINKLRMCGFNVSVDDFGMGYSSLSYLQKLNFSELKIDQSFTSRLDELATVEIVKSIINIAHFLKMEVVAEGVETTEQVHTLQTLGCEHVQGYHYFKPMPLQEVEQLF